MTPRFLILALLFLLTFFDPVAAEISITGTGVLMEPPGAYKSADTYTGITAEDDSWWIMVMELPVPAPADQILAQMTDSKMAERGMVVQSREAFETRSGPTTLMVVTQDQGGLTYEKLVLVVGNGSKTVTVTVGYGQWLSSDLREPMMASLRTVRLTESSSEVNLDGLPFDFDESADMEVNYRSLASIVFAPVGDENLEKEVFLSLGAIEPGIGFGPEEVMMSQLEDAYSDLSITQSRTVEIDGLTALEVLATGVDPKTAEEASIYFFILPGPRTGLYFFAFGETPKGSLGEWEAKFQALSHSLRARE